MLRVFRYEKEVPEDAGFDKPSVVIVGADVGDEGLERVREGFPNSLRIAECKAGEDAKDGFVSVLRIADTDLSSFDFDMKGCKSILIDGAPMMFDTELQDYIVSIAKKAALPVSRVRLCCHLSSVQDGCNLSCYAATVLRDFAAEEDLMKIFTTSKKECWDDKTLCRCVR